MTTLFTDPGSNGEVTGEVAHLLVALTPDVLGRVEGVVVGHGQHFAGLGIQHHRRDVACPGQVLGLLHLLLDVELNVVVEGELDGRAVDRLVLIAVAAGDHHAVGAAVVGDGAVGAGQLGVHGILQPEQTVAVPVDSADDVGRQRSAGILAQVLAFGADLGVFGGDGGGDRRVDGTGQIDECLVTAQLLQHGGLVRLVVQPQRHLLGDLRQSLLRVGGFRVLLLGLRQLLVDPARLEGQRAGLDGERELVVVAVDDAAAQRFLDIGDLELAGRLRTQPGCARHLQIEQLDGRHQQRQEDDRVAGSVPEDERRAAGPELHRLAGTTVARRADRRARLCPRIFFGRRGFVPSSFGLRA